MTLTMSGSQAKRRSAYWRIAALAVAVFAAGLWAVQTPLTSPDVRVEPVRAAGATGLAPPAAQPAASEPIDPQTLAGAVDRLNHVLGRTPKEPEPTGGEVAPAPSLSGWRYIGSIIEPLRRIAIVSINGKQAVLAEGRSFEGVTIVQVKADALVVNDGEKQLELPKEAKSGSSVAWVSPAPGGAGGQAIMNNVGTAGTTINAGGVTTSVPGQAGYTPEELAQLRERGIDPEQAARMRQRLQQQRERGRMSPDGNCVMRSRTKQPQPTPAQDATDPTADGADAPTR